MHIPVRVPICANFYYKYSIQVGRDKRQAEAKQRRVGGEAETGTQQREKQQRAEAATN